MKVIGIDPGQEYSHFVSWEDGIIDKGSHQNFVILHMLEIASRNSLIGIEQIRGYGLKVGNETFDTCFWTGRFYEVAAKNGGGVVMVPRKNIITHFCGNATAGDKFLRQALVDIYGDPGTKKNPGTLFGISGHLWAALGVALYVEHVSKQKVDSLEDNNYERKDA